MTLVDWAIMIFLAMAAFVGLAQGFVRTLFALGGLVLGLELAFRNYGHAATALMPMIHSHRVANAVAFLAIAFMIMALAGIVGIFLAKLFRMIGLGLIDIRICAGCYGGGCVYPGNRSLLPPGKLAPDFENAAIVFPGLRTDFEHEPIETGSTSATRHRNIEAGGRTLKGTLQLTE